MTEEEFKAEVKEGIDWFKSKPLRKFLDKDRFNDLTQKTFDIIRESVLEKESDDVDLYDFTMIDAPLPENILTTIHKIRDKAFEPLAEGLSRMIESHINAVITKAKAEGMSEQRAHEFAAEVIEADLVTWR